MSYRLELSIRGLPKRTNNNTGNWRARHAEARKWKRLVSEAVLEIHPSWLYEPKPLARAKLTLTRHSSAEPDFDGLVSGFKHVIDGLIEVGVIANDKRENIGIPDYQWIKCARNEGKIEIIVEEI